MKKRFVLFTASLVLLQSCSSEKEKEVLEVYEVTSPLMIDTVFNSEYVADIQSLQNVELRARVKGYIDNIYIDEGKSVQAGQLLFSINSKHYQEELTRAKASLKNAVAGAKLAELEMKNVRILVDKNVVGKTEMEMAEAKLDAANARVDEAKSEEATAELNLSFLQIKAPFDGVINRIRNKVGSLIDEGTLLTTISNNKEVFAYFNVSEREYLEITSHKKSESNKEVSLILANNQLYPLKGIIETVEGEFDESTGNIAFRARFNNPDGILKHGSSGKIVLEKELKKSLVIPQKTTFEIQENTYVFMVDKNNVAHMKSIIPKLRIDNIYVIESGLTVNDRIILEGIQLVKEGDKITPKQVVAKEAIK